MRLDKMWFLRCQSDANIYLLTFAFSLENHEISQQKEVTCNDFDQWFYQSSQICVWSWECKVICAYLVQVIKISILICFLNYFCNAL